ncbi:uncharacterized protein LOC141700980 [Apium graveolens]|uniref:uncharacterized protein LOC141700980 n=1 Tax=Apium graveolens TaxID=4045 RepID=UPI003D7A9566
MRMINNGDPTLLTLEKDLIIKLNMALVEDEYLFLQKYRVKWMGLGDGNNSFFHKQCKANWNHNKVLALQDSGTMVHGQLPCANLAVNYFKNLLAPEIIHSCIDLEPMDCKVLTEAQATLLCAQVTYAIILDTLKKLKKNKAPGPDGFNVEFFLATSSTTRPDFCPSVKNFFETGFSLRALLIKSVVCAIEAFWCNHFLLPGAVHSTIQSLLTKFLWRGNINHKGGAKIARMEQGSNYWSHAKGHH